MKTRVALVLFFSALLVVSQIFAQIPIAVGQLHVCASPTGGVRIIHLPGFPTTCPAGWQYIVVPAIGPRGPQGPPGPQGTPGSPGGLMCWDVNGNGAADPTEDRNGDGVVTAADCQGPQGLQGPPGIQGLQ